jgi:hypothetical protein
MYSSEFDPKWKERFSRLPDDLKERVIKKMRQILNGLPGRHLRFGVDFFVEEVGQYRICYKSFEDRKARRFYFIGDHKEYEKWIREQ